MPTETSIASGYAAYVDYIADTVAPLDPSIAECVLETALKRCREKRYFGRTFGSAELWRGVIRPGYEQYLVSNHGYVRHSAKRNCLIPAFQHAYARAGMSAPGRPGAKNHMIHELVFESFTLGFPIPDNFRDNKKFRVIDHKDSDKYNPSLDNLELTDQGENMRRAYQNRRRNPRD